MPCSFFVEKFIIIGQPHCSVVEQRPRHAAFSLRNSAYDDMKSIEMVAHLHLRTWANCFEIC